MTVAAASEGMHMEQMDVTTAFLYVELEEEVCLPGDPGGDVCRGNAREGPSAPEGALRAEAVPKNVEPTH